MGRKFFGVGFSVVGNAAGVGLAEAPSGSLVGASVGRLVLVRSTVGLLSISLRLATDDLNDCFAVPCTVDT